MGVKLRVNVLIVNVLVETHAWVAVSANDQ